MTRIRLIICLTGYRTKHYAVHFKKRASWVKPAAINFGVELMPDSLQSGRRYK